MHNTKNKKGNERYDAYFQHNPRILRHEQKINTAKATLQVHNSSCYNQGITETPVKISIQKAHKV